MPIHQYLDSSFAVKPEVVLPEVQMVSNERKESVGNEQTSCYNLESSP